MHAMPATFSVDVPEGANVTEDVPLVLAFGWINALDKHVKKYTDVVNASCKCVTVRSTIPTRDGFAPSAGPRVRYVREALRFTETVIRDVYRGKAPKKRYLYVFSNGGCWVVSTLCGFSKEEIMKFDGVVFDSCPAFMSMKSGGDALTAVMRQPFATVVRLAFYVSVCLLQLYHVVTFSYEEMLTRKFWKTMMTMENFPKELYIYSMDDKLTDSAKLEELIEFRKGNGANIELLRFDSSPHCAHLRSHPDEYVKALDAFFI